jgi:putative transposase
MRITTDRCGTVFWGLSFSERPIRLGGTVRQTWLERDKGPATFGVMTQRSPFRYFKTSPEIIRLAVMLYVRFPLSLRNGEDLLHERGIEVSHETVRFWWQRFGPMFAAEIRRKRVSSLRCSRWRWHLDEVFVRVNGVQHYLWRAVDHEGEVLEAFVSKARDRDAAEVPAQVDEAARRRGGRDRQAPSYGAALKELGIQEKRVTDRWENNRARTRTAVPTTRARHAALPAHALAPEVRRRPRVSA